MRRSGLIAVAVVGIAAGAFALSAVGADAPAAEFATANVTSDVVEGTLPAPNSIAPNPDTPVELALRDPVDPASFDPATLAVFGRWSGVMTGEVSVLDGGRRIRFEPSEPFQHGEAVTVTLESGAPLAGGGEASTGFAWSFWIQPEAGSLDMIDRGERILLEDGEDHVQPYGAYAGDFNLDGYPDLAIPNEVSADVRIMLNDGAGNYDEFQILDIPGGAWPSPNEGEDFNRDGITDFVVGNAGNDLVTLFLGDGQGWFDQGSNTNSGQNVRGVCIMDLNHDGWPDVGAVNMAEGPDESKGNVAILLNDGDGTGRLTRTAEIASPGRGEKTCAVGDANGDGHQDLFVGAYFTDEVLIFMGDGEGNLTLGQRQTAGGRPWMIVTGDVNGDGHVDVMSANREGNNVAVLLGDGAGGLAEPRRYDTGGSPLAVDVGDLDGDGDLDVVTSDFDGNSFTVHENAGDGTLVNPRSYAASASGSCAIIHDRDRDGDLDLTGVDETDDKIFLLENPGG
ncbi:MAG: FG-GAP-like repeat-containing protein [Gemmatimonadota bacterium]|nr:FG-GAP-like repeat-containing protein [Gemmatimonadota bacterium]